MTTHLYRISALSGLVGYTDLMDALDSSLSGAGQLITRHVAAMPSNWFFTDVWYQIIRPLRFRKYVKPKAGPGGSGCEALTANVAASITRVGDVAGRKYVGGVRIPIGTDVECIDGGKVTAAHTVLLVNYASAMKLNVITSGTVGTFIPQVGLPAPADTSADLYDAFPQETVRVNHRRTVGLGI
jgi:hypothetical protein